MNRPGDFFCSCRPGWTGTLCDIGKLIDANDKHTHIHIALTEQEVPQLLDAALFHFEV